MRLKSISAMTNNDANRQLAERQRRRSEREFADFFDNGLVALQWLGPEGQILRANQAQLDLLGYGHPEYVGRNIAEFCLDGQGFLNLLGRLSQDETVRDQVVGRLFKD